MKRTRSNGYLRAGAWAVGAAVLFAAAFLTLIEGGGAPRLSADRRQGLDPLAVVERLLGSAPRGHLTDRLIYPYSVVAGGVTSPEEVRAAVGRDPVVARHYQGFDVRRAVATTVAAPRLVYVSYRVKDKVYYSKKKMKLAAGEKVISDGKNLIRARCGNRIAEAPQAPVSVDEPSEAVLNAPVLPVVTPREEIAAAIPTTPPGATPENLAQVLVPPELAPPGVPMTVSDNPTFAPGYLLPPVSTTTPPGGPGGDNPPTPPVTPPDNPPTNPPDNPPGPPVTPPTNPPDNPPTNPPTDPPTNPPDNPPTDPPGPPVTPPTNPPVAPPVAPPTTPPGEPPTTPPNGPDGPAPLPPTSPSGTPPSTPPTSGPPSPNGEPPNILPPVPEGLLPPDGILPPGPLPLDPDAPTPLPPGEIPPPPPVPEPSTYALMGLGLAGLAAMARSKKR